ncbi:MAG: TraB/GumN family protein [Candidatus Thermoplasmatota archaeon]
MMITLIGSAHVLDISDSIEQEITARVPGVVAVELDRVRYQALKSEERNMDRNVPMLYRLLHKVQQRIAEKFGVEIGGEMLTAVDTAKKIGAAIAFIDMPAQNFLSRLMDEMSFKEKVTLFFGAVVGLFISKERVEKEIDRYQSGDVNHNNMMSIEMPAIKRILIDERNEFMAENLKELEDKFESVVAVVGDGHIPGMKRLLRDRDIEVLRLKDIQERTSSEEGQEHEGKEDEGAGQPAQDNTEVSFSYEYRYGED